MSKRCSRTAADSTRGRCTLISDLGDASPLGGLVASGGYTISLWYLSGHSYLRAPGNEWAFLGGFDWHVQFPRPLRPGDRVRARSVVTEKRLSSKPGRGVVNTQADLIDRSDEPVLRISSAIMMATRPTTT
jgi:acyl dehydratase